MTYYIKGGSRYNEANPKVWVALMLGGFPDADYLLTDWKNLDDKSHETVQDPFWRMGGSTGGVKEFELGLWNDYRIKITTSGIYGWVGPGVDDFDTLGGGGGATVLNDLTDVVITGTPAENEVLAYDTTSSKWINQTGGEAGLALSSELHTEDHDNAHHTTNYEVANANIQSHVASPVTDAHHTLYTLEQHDNSHHSTNYHTEADGTGAVTVHSDITSVGSGIIITTLERDALHTIVVAGDLNHNDLANIDADDIKHITATQLGNLHEIYTLEQHDNAYHSTNYHTESDGTGAVTVHSGITDAGSGIIISDGERGDLHAIYTLESHNNTYHSVTFVDAAGAVSAVNTAGLSLATTKVYNSVAEEYAHYLGRNQIGYDTSNASYFGYRGFNNTTQYGFKQSSSWVNTYINAVTQVWLEIGGNSRLNITDDGVQLSTGERVNDFEAGAVVDDDTKVPTMGSLFTALAGLVLGDTKEDSHAYVEATALVMENDITFNAGQLFDTKDVSTLGTDAEALTHVEATGLDMDAGTEIILNSNQATELLRIWTTNDTTANAYINQEIDGSLYIKGFHTTVIGQNEGDGSALLTVANTVITMNKPLAMSAKAITGVENPTNDQDAATKIYADNVPILPIDATPVADGDYHGTVLTIDTTGCATYDVVYCDLANSVLPANANAIATSKVIGMVVEAGKVLIDGIVRNDAWTLTPGTVYYANEVTPGTWDATQPAGDTDVIIAIGIAVGVDQLLVRPGYAWVEVVV